MIKLEKLVLVKFSEDATVVPRGTEWFGFYKLGKDYYQLLDGAAQQKFMHEYMYVEKLLAGWLGGLKAHPDFGVSVKFYI